MMNTRVIGITLGLFIGAWVSNTSGSYARVESMGKRATFFMDDISIFDNSANINVFPNFLIGEMGRYSQGDIDKKAINSLTTTNYSNPRYNRDPEDPWFGGIFSYSLSKRGDGNLYPQLSIGGAFNRRDTELFSLLPNHVITATDTVIVPEPVTNFDGFLGFTLANGGMLGSHIYAAVQEGANIKNGELGEVHPDISSMLLKADIGFNWPLARSVDGELSFGGAMSRFGPSSIESDFSFFLKARAFSTIELINGELVPVFTYTSLNAPGTAKDLVTAGCGINASLDRGFFWLGVEWLFSSNELTGMSDHDSLGQVYTIGDNQRVKHTTNGGRISFGIERNIWWDWLVIRVGGQKDIVYHEEKNVSGYWATNPVSNGTIDDHIGWGIGINVEEKLKVDATLAEDVLFSGGNLFSGPQHHVVSRISATYSF